MAQVTKDLIDKTVFKKTDQEKTRLQEEKLKWNNNFRNNPSFRNQREDFIRHFMTQPTPNWGWLTFSVIL